MRAGNANRARRAILRCDRNRAFTDNWCLKLADLVALGKVGIEVVLAVENRVLIDLRANRETEAYR